MNKKNITVVGLGYIGLPTAIILASAGHNVKGYDAKKSVVESLQQGHIHIVENHLQEAFERVIASKNLTVYEQLPVSDVYILCVPTPFYENQKEKVADISYVENAARMVAKVLKKGDLVILESTVPPYTTRRMSDILEEESQLSREDFYTVHCPERVLPGRILYELEHNDRIIGSENPQAGQMAKELYETFVKEGTCYVCDDVTAELCKLVENTYRDINIAFANQLSEICKTAGIDVFELIELANKHPRVNILTPGLGVGGHCLAVDPWFLVEKYKEEASLIKVAREINDDKPLWIMKQVEEALHNDSSKKIAILGMAYKANIDDMRESPSMTLAQAFKAKGYAVYGVEPNTNRKELNGVEILSLDDALNTCDYAVIALNHKEFLEEDAKKAILQKPHYDCIGFDEGC